MKKKITVLGASGSVGSQTIDVLLQHKDLYEIFAVSVGKNISYLRNFLNEHPVRYACVECREDYEIIKNEYPDTEFFYGDEGLIKITSLPADLVFNNILGFAGLMPTLNAIEHHIDVAVANKESLIAAGDLVMRSAAENNVKIIPVDSEHSAIFQTINGYDDRDISRLIITASGGAFKNLSREDLKSVTREDALKHPKWHMGEKITIDSATMMNKGFEVIEAHVLFDIPYERIETVLHPESIVHSMTEFVDHSVLAQLAVADMRLPIQYALTYPRRISNSSNTLDLCQIGTLHFQKMDEERFPLITLAYDVGKMGGNMPAILNGSNEQAVEGFLEGKCSFLDIEKINFRVVELGKEIFASNPSLSDIIFANNWAVAKAKELMEMK